MTKRDKKLNKPSIVIAIALFALVSPLLFVPSNASADTTGILLPTGDGGNDSANWIAKSTNTACNTTDCFSDVNEASGTSCSSTSDGDGTFAKSGAVTDAQTFNINGLTIPNYATITNIAVTVCYKQDQAGSTFQTRYCLDGTCADSGANISNTSNYLQATQNFPVSYLKTSGSDIEVGLQSTSTTRSRVSSVSAVITYVPDITPPSITSIGVDSITNNTARIFWTTDEASDSQVLYGLNSSYDQSTLIDSILTTSHSMVITGLSPDNIYHFAVKSKDAAGNLIASGDQTFASPHTIPPFISLVSPHAILQTSLEISWLTDEPADSQIEYGTGIEYGSMTALDPTLVLNHQQTVSGLLPDTSYHLRVRSHDFADNLSFSDDFTFRTLPLVTLPLSGGSSGVIASPPKDPFHIEGVLVKDLTSTAVSISWTTDMPATTAVDYGLTSAYTSNAQKDSELTTLHQQTLRYLIPNTEYHFRAVSVDISGNTVYSIDTTFKTAGGLPDTNAPTAIKDLEVGDISATSLTLFWTTPEDEIGVIFYDINRANVVIDEENFHDAKITHETVITVENVEESGVRHSYRVVGLTPGETVYFAVKSQDPFQNISLISNVVSAKLPTDIPEDKQAPAKVSNVQAAGLDKLIFLSWTNPKDGDFTRVRITRSETGYSKDPFSGTLVYDGNKTRFSDPNLDNRKTYYYSIFSYDKVPNYSDPVQLSLAPYAERRHYHILDIAGNAISGFSVTKDFEFGSRDDEISHLQEFLAQDPLIYPEGFITGYFGSFTREAVKRLQRKNGIAETGKVDSAFRALLKDMQSSQVITENTSKGVIKSLTHDLSFGMRKDEVKIIQEYLEKQGFLKKGFITGYFGSLTKQAVINFQKSNKIVPAVGYVGPLTRAKMLENAESILGIQASDAKLVASDLKVPWSLAFLPDNTILVTERPGNLAIIKGGSITRIPVDGVYSKGEGGLLGITLHPDFIKNNFIYLYSSYQESGQVKNKVERYLFSDNTLKDKKIIVDGIPASAVHNGGRLAFGPDGYLYITTGYADNDSFSQDTVSLAGKILRLGDDGAIPEDNPFKNHVYAYGFRNPQGLTWDDQGNLWATDHGRSGVLSGFDEINLIVKGKNYGWPVAQEGQLIPGMELSVINSGTDKTWAPAGIVFADGSLFFGGLRGQALYEAKIENSRVLNLNEHFAGQFGRIRAVNKDLNGNIYFTTSNTDGRGNPSLNDDKLMKIDKLR